MRFELSGTEAMTIELHGTLAAADARHFLAPARLEPTPLPSLTPGEPSRIEVDLLLFEMRGIGVTGLPGPRFNYREALWRIGVLHEGAPAWLSVCCDLDHALVRTGGALAIRYPVRKATLSLTDTSPAWTARIEAQQGTLDTTVRVSDDVAPVHPPRPMLVQDGDHVYRIPWTEDAAPFRRHATAEIQGDLAEKTLGASLRWDPTALVHRGRVHHCSVARKLR